MSNAFNAYHYIALGCAAVVLFIIIQYFGALVDFVRSTFKRRASRKRAVERLQNLPRGEPLKPQPAVSTELALPVGAEIQPAPEGAEPLYSGNSQRLHDSIVRQNILDALIVDQPTDAVTHRLSEAHPAASTELPRSVNTKVEPILEPAEPLDVQPAVSAEAPLLVGAEVQPILERVKPLEVQLAASTEAPLPASAEVQPILEREVQLSASTASVPVGGEIQPAPEGAEPLYSGNSQRLHDSIVRQNILDALIVDQPTDAVTHRLSEAHPAASTELPRSVNTKVEPILEPAEPPDVQPAVSAEAPLPVGAEVQPILERTEPQVQPTPRPDLPLPIGTRVRPILERAEPRVQPAARPELPLPISTKVRPILERAGPQVQPAARPELPLQVGSKVWAVCKFGSVTQGTPGIITGAAEVRFFWQSPTYLCTFANNMKVRARPKDIEPYNHAHSLEELEQPDLKSIQSRRLTMRAEQLLSRQRPTRLHSST
jgi:hypothetical protein